LYGENIKYIGLRRTQKRQFYNNYKIKLHYRLFKFEICNKLVI